MEVGTNPPTGSLLAGHYVLLRTTRAFRGREIPRVVYSLQLCITYGDVHIRNAVPYCVYTLKSQENDSFIWMFYVSNEMVPVEDMWITKKSLSSLQELGLVRRVLKPALADLGFCDVSSFLKTTFSGLNFTLLPGPAPVEYTL